MTDYNKLTVVKLKEELKQRGLPQTGLKAVLVARLTEADTQSTEAPIASAADNVNDVPQIAQVLENKKPPSPAENGSVPQPPQSTANAPDAPKLKESKPSQSKIVSQVTPAQPTPTVEGSDLEKERLPEPKHHSTKTGETLPQQPIAAPDAEGYTDDTPNFKSQRAVVDGPATLPSPETSITQADVPTHPQTSTQTSLNNEEILEDSRKRKRRSQSPAPSTYDSALKKAKAIDGSPVVKLAEDGKPKYEKSDVTMVESERVEIPEINGQSLKDMPVETGMGNKPAPYEDEPKIKEITLTQPTVMDIEPGEDQRRPPAVQPSPSDTRFKNLFSAPPKPAEPPPSQDSHQDIEDRDISPALHPATSALYIRNFMRPLQPAGLKAHLAALAKPPNSSPSGEIVTDFFLDTIRTHCLVRFNTITAASRVRSALHHRVWPDEKTRNPLWVDFIPEEKLKKWIDVEQSGAGNRNQPSKRWEVVYEQEGGGVAAYLQEADGAGRPRLSVSQLQRPDSIVQPKAPTAPKPTGDVGKGFKALDDLFKSTAAKPKLYYQPVPEGIANRRLDKLMAGKGGGRNDEMRRFTFEEEMLVDKGPEFGSGWRGGARGRGGYGGAYSARGTSGGYRGDRGDRGDMRDNWRGGR